jgi:hypothetical protein
VALDLPLVTSLVELPLERVEELLDDLEQRRLVLYDGTRYTFAAALIPQVIRAEGITSGLRRRLTRRAIEELEARGDLESRVLLAELRAKGDPGALAAAARMASKGDPARQKVVEDLRLSLGGGETQTEPEI